MDEWLEALVIERLDAQGYDDLDAEDVEDAWDETSIEEAKQKLIDEIDAAIAQAVNDSDTYAEEEEDDLDEDEDSEEFEDVEHFPWAARGR